ncbi:MULTISPECIES: ACP phosphodiesterase [Pseudoalteromonas]|uniref:ACP phosphodiesterase n=1 Tax=Pseudoalteromonas amylolytica TaxID=1859457 RepID=A0A1S1MPX6_9GAMM|nr:MULTISPECIES: ACP phosphodiesterase [Pseudoalteromonas]OHU84236.1 ACP phosphodiesterase [Pseudoalteromonas sp. JW3]OHU87223.1 ACP phosphodiesterase [Pseudoalteromonas amylolytica]
MNYLAHLYLAQPNADSHFGNLLGDFGGTRHVRNMPLTVKKALDNHYLVDKFTDNHAAIKDAKRYFSQQRKRFAGIAIDVVFDHFLIQHWAQFNHEPLADFKQNSYQLLNKRVPDMPSRMQQVISNMTKNDWFKEYETITGIGIALDNIAKRIRFTNNFYGAIEDIQCHYNELELLFLEFFPQLIDHVNQNAIEGSKVRSIVRHN